MLTWIKNNLWGKGAWGVYVLLGAILSGITWGLCLEGSWRKLTDKQWDYMEVYIDFGWLLPVALVILFGYWHLTGWFGRKKV